mgnify:CR=1 FL=1
MNLRIFSAIALLALVVGASLPLLVAGPAQATVHPINSAECAAPPADGTAADTQEPPGISDPTAPAFLQPLESTIFRGHFGALNGDNGDSVCVFPETTSHGNPEPGYPDEHAGEDGTLPTGASLPGRGPA